jgi:two-component system, chemotaxis family, CheB/CheR fusion protein
MTATPTADPAFDALLQFLQHSRGFDFTGYKRASLERRIRRRMEAVGCAAYDAYLDHLEVHPDEYQRLFDTILINVTDFFRDPPVWDELRDEGLPVLLSGKPADDPIRVWSAGCATGQEACTIAMVLCEALGEREFRRRVKIYATDVDEAALAIARQGVYPAAALEHVPEELRGRYFERTDHGLEFRPDLRRSLIFGRNDLVQDAPISRLDLLVCRNTLMYLTAETQAHVLRHFHFALRDTGVLMLGRPEMMLSQRDLFVPIDLKRRLFRRVVRTPSLQARVAAMVSGEHVATATGDVRDAALEVAPHAELIVSPTGVLTFANLAARSTFALGAESIGRPLAELRVSGEPVDLLGPVEQAIGQRRRVPLGEVAHVSAKGDQRRLDVSVLPLPAGDGGPLGAAALRERTGELDGGFLESILTSLGVAIAVLDEHQRVQIWNRGAEDLWGVRADEAADRHFLALDIGLEPERLAPALRAVIGGASRREVAELETVNRRGRNVMCTTTVMPLAAADGDAHALRGAIVLMEDHPSPDGDGS